MSLLRPGFLWLLVGVVALVAIYVVMQRRKRHYAVRFTNLDLLESVAPKRPGWRRHLPAAVIALAMIVGIIGLARPAHDIRVQKKTAIVMLVMDVSASMAATDVAPTRLDASIKAATAFVKSLPSTFSVGLVAFSSNTQVLNAPTTDHDAVTKSIGALELGKGTAAGDGIDAALAAIKAAQAAAGQDLATRTTTAGAPAAGDGEPVSATIVLLSDGGTPQRQGAARRAPGREPGRVDRSGARRGQSIRPDQYRAPRLAMVISRSAKARNHTTSSRCSVVCPTAPLIER